MKAAIPMVFPLLLNRCLWKSIAFASLTYAMILCYKQFYHSSADFATFLVI